MFCDQSQPGRLANWENMKDDLNKLHEDIIKMKDQKSNVNTMWTHFQTKLEKNIDVNVPKKIARKKCSLVFGWISLG
jgi:hypothetical protein